jgi:hypothetical protein
MIKIFDYATLSPPSSCSINRNRYEVAIRLNPKRFRFGAFSKYMHACMQFVFKYACKQDGEASERIIGLIERTIKRL